MPGVPRAKCINNEINQRSSGQAGTEIDLDLGTLFAAVNKLIRCTNAVADYLGQGFESGNDTGSSSAGGGTGTGSGSTGTGSQGAPTISEQSPTPDSQQRVSSSSNFTLSLPSSGKNLAIVDATAAISVSLPAPLGGQWAIIQNANATNSITVKDDLGGTIATLAPGGFIEVGVVENASGVVAWFTNAMVYSGDAKRFTSADVIWTSNTTGPVLKDSGGSYWRLGVSTLGVISASSTAAESPSTPPT